MLDVRQDRRPVPTHYDGSASADPQPPRRWHMRTLVIYESLYGNTHMVASGIADGLRAHGDVQLVPADEATDELVASADLVVVGGPTHGHGMTRASTRAEARDRAGKPGSALTLDEHADGLASATGWAPCATARTRWPPRSTRGSTCRRCSPVGRRPASRTGCVAMASGSQSSPRASSSTGTTSSVAGEADRARDWGSSLVSALTIPSLSVLASRRRSTPSTARQRQLCGRRAATRAHCLTVDRQDPH